MAGALEVAADSISDAARFLAKNAKGITVQFMKVAALGLLLHIIFVLALVVIDAVGGGLSTTLGTGGMYDPPVMVLIGIVVVLFGLFSIGNATLSAVNYNIVDDITKDEKTDIIKRAKTLLIPIGQFSIIIMAMMLLTLVLPAVFGAIGFLGLMAPALVFLTLLVASIAVLFSIQFSFPEIAIRGNGIIESFRKSHEMVWKNPWGVLTVDTIMLVLMASITLGFYAMHETLATAFTNLVSEPAQTGVLLVVSMALSLFQSVVLSLVSVPLIYFLWRKVSLGEALGHEVPKTPETPKKKRLKK